MSRMLNEQVIMLIMRDIVLSAFVLGFATGLYPHLVHNMCLTSSRTPPLGARQRSVRSTSTLHRHLYPLHDLQRRSVRKPEYPDGDCFTVHCGRSGIGALDKFGVSRK